MQVKTKFLSVLFVFAFFIPCLFMFTACGDDDKDLKDNEITISVSDKVYDGQAIAVTATATSGAAPIIRYKLAGADDSTYTTTAPKDAGQYVVGAGLEATDEWKAAAKTANFAITAKEVGLNWTAPQNLVYNGQAKVPTVAATGLVAGDTCTINAALTATKDNVNVGTFTFTASGLSNPNYKLPTTGLTSAQYTITKKVLANLETTVTYNGSNSHTIDLSDDVEQGLAVVVTFESANVGADPTGAVLTGSKAGNYELDEETCDVSIVAKEIGLSWTAPADLVYDGNQKVPTVAATGLIQGDSCDVTPQLDQGDNVNVTSNGFTYVATQVSDTNYKLPTNKVSPTYMITPMILTDLNAELTYSGSPTISTDINTHLSLAITFTSKNVGASVQSYVFYFDGDETDNFDLKTEGEHACTASIVAKELEGLQWTAPADLVYSGTAKVPTVVANGLIAGDVCTVNAAVTATNDNVNVGTFTFTATGLSGADAGNYSLPVGTTSSEYTITPRVLTLQWTAPANLKYNNQAKVPTVAATNIVSGDVCNITSEITLGKDNVHMGDPFTFEATGLTGADAGNYVLPTDVESPSYQVVIDTLELNGETTNFGVFNGEAWFAIPVSIAGKYEILTTGFASFNYQTLYTTNDGINFTPVENVYQGYRQYEQFNNSTYIYVCFDGVASTVYYLQIRNNTNANGTIKWISHSHNYKYMNNDVCYCDHFKGTTLDCGVTSEPQTESAGVELKFRFRTKCRYSYYMTLSGMVITSSNCDLYFGEQGDQGFEEDFIEAFDAAHAAVAPDDDWVYVYYTVPAGGINNATITFNEIAIDAHGFSGSSFVGKTIKMNQEVAVPDLANGEKLFLRFPIQECFKYACLKSSNISITSEIEFYVKSAGNWESEALTWGENNTRAITHASDDGYCYVIITSVDGIEGTFSMISTFNNSGANLSTATATLGAAETVTINAGAKAYYRVAINSTDRYCIAENFTSGGADATMTVYYIKDGAFKTLTPALNNLGGGEYTHTTQSAITNSDDGYLYICVYANQAIASKSLEITTVVL